VPTPNPVVDELVTTHGITRAAAYRIVSEREDEEQASLPAPSLSSKVKIVEYLVLHGRQSSPRQMALDIGMDMHNMVHVMWALNKQRFIKFRELGRGNAGARIINIEASAEGIRWCSIQLTGKPPEIAPRKTRTVEIEPVVDSAGKMNDKPDGVFPAKSGRGHVARADDALNLANYGTRAQGGPIERIFPAVTSDRLPQHQNEKPETELDMPRMAEVIDAAFGSEVPERLVTRTISIGVPEMSEFPIVANLVSRGSKLRAAARLLDEAGQTDLAVQTLDKEKSMYSPVEAELMTLARLIKMVL
jgi:hypothetical protein